MTLSRVAVKLREAKAGTMLTTRDSNGLSSGGQHAHHQEARRVLGRPCPAVYDTDDPEMVGVQGAILTDAQALSDIGEIPAHESVVLLPRGLFESYVRGRP